MELTIREFFYPVNDAVERIRKFVGLTSANPTIQPEAAEYPIDTSEEPPGYYSP